MNLILQQHSGMSKEMSYILICQFQINLIEL
jgi:hypothetical protein